MRLMIAIALLLAFLTNGAVAQYRGEANAGAILTMAQQGVGADSIASQWTSGKVCLRKLLTGLPDGNSTLPGPPCSGDFKLFREIEAVQFPKTRPYLGTAQTRKLRPVTPSSPFRPPIS